MKIKVCHITTVHQPFDVRVFHKECTSLAKHGYEVYCIARHDRDESVNDVRIIAIPNETAKGFGRLINTWNAFKKALQLKTKIYHIHDPELLPVGLLLKLFTGAKIIYDAHEDPKLHTMHKGWMNKYVRYIFAYSIGFLEWFCEKFYDKVIIVLDTHAKRFRTSTLILHNYPIFEKSVLQSSDEQKNNKLIYVGTIREERGIIEILHAVIEIKKKISEIKFDLIGPFIPPSFEKKIRAIINENNLVQNVEVFGKIPFSDVTKYVINADIGIAFARPDPNYHNALPTKVFEYMMLRKAVVVSKTPITEKIITDYKCGITVNLLTPNEIAREVINLLEDDESRILMGENGYRVVSNNINWQTEELKLIECYNSLI